VKLSLEKLQLWLTSNTKTQVRVINAGDISTPRKHFWKHLTFLYYWQ